MSSTTSVSNIYGSGFPVIGVALSWRTLPEEAILLHRSLDRLGREVVALTQATAEFLHLPVFSVGTLPPLGNIPLYFQQEVGDAESSLARVSAVMMRSPQFDRWLVRDTILDYGLPVIEWTLGGIHQALERLEVALWRDSFGT